MERDLPVEERDTSSLWSHLFEEPVLLPQGITIMLGQTLLPKPEAVTTAGDAGLGIEFGSPSPEGNLTSLGCLGPCVLAWTAQLFRHCSVSWRTSLTNHNSSKKPWSTKLPTSYFLDKIGVFQIYLKGSF